MEVTVTKKSNVGGVQSERTVTVKGYDGNRQNLLEILGCAAARPVGADADGFIMGFDLARGKDQTVWNVYGPGLFSKGEKA